MAGKSLEPAPPPRPHSERAGEEGSTERGGERYGPVAITRLRKDDGRALILYRLEEGEP